MIFFNFWLIFAIGFLNVVLSLEIEEPKFYAPRTVPSNVPKTRQVLGYDKYEKQPVQSSSRTAKATNLYGNNWEQFGSPEVEFNFGFKG